MLLRLIAQQQNQIRMDQNIIRLEEQHRHHHDRERELERERE
jgi:hypothetical protein